MSTTSTTPTAALDGAAPVEPVVVLVDAATKTERELIAAWAASSHPGAELVEREPAKLDPVLARRDDPKLVPARISWLPRERDGDRRVRPADLLTLTHPRRPRPRMQQRIARREPDRAQVTVGAAAQVQELCRRFRDEAGAGAASDELGAFVARQATLACDRAERAVIGDRYKVPRLTAEQIMGSADFRARVEQLSERLDRPREELLAYAADCLEEVTAVMSPVAIDAFRLMMSPLHAPAWNVETDSASLERLRELNRRHALVFLPAHRTYPDPLVLAEVLHEHDFPRNHILGGDNMAFWPIGPIGKRAGVIFIRRSFGDDAVYKLAVKAYFGHLAAKRFNLEWYIEGGRSRTGKLRPPRYGLLHYLVRAVRDGAAEDVMLVPVSLVYEGAQEVNAMAAEQGGAAKRGEGLRWLFDYVRAQRRNEGTARVNFGEPFSLTGALAEAGEGSAQLDKVAFRICDGINRATPVTPTALVTFALLATRDRALTLEQIGRVTAPLLDYVEARGLAAPVGELRRPSGLRSALGRLEQSGVVSCFDGGTEAVWSVERGRERVAAFYRNSAIHHFVNRAIVELALLKLASAAVDGDPVEAAWGEALRLRDLLKFEFFFADKRTFRDELSAELELIDTSWRDRVEGPEQAGELLRASGALVAHRVLRSFLDAQLVVASRLAARDPREPVERRAFVDECLGSGHQMVLQRRLHGDDSVSRELFESGLELAANRDLLDPGREPVAAARRELLAEIEEFLALIRRVEALDAELLEEVLGG